MIVWLLVAGAGVLLAGRTAYRVYRARRRSVRDELEEMLKKSGYGRREIRRILDAYRDDVLASTDDDTTDWRGYFFAVTASVRELFGEIVVTESYEDPDDELEVVSSGLKLYPDAYAGLLAYELRTWIRDLRRTNRISQADYNQRMDDADFIDPEQEVREQAPRRVHPQDDPYDPSFYSPRK